MSLFKTHISSWTQCLLQHGHLVPSDDLLRESLLIIVEGACLTNVIVVHVSVIPSHPVRVIYKAGALGVIDWGCLGCHQFPRGLGWQMCYVVIVKVESQIFPEEVAINPDLPPGCGDNIATSDIFELTLWP